MVFTINSKVSKKISRLLLLGITSKLLFVLSGSFFLASVEENVYSNYSFSSAVDEIEGVFSLVQYAELANEKDVEDLLEKGKDSFANPLLTSFDKTSKRLAPEFQLGKSTSSWIRVLENSLPFYIRSKRLKVYC
jgi:hypothetical protein